MSLEQRVETLEREMAVLKGAIQQTLLEVQEELVQEVAPSPAPSRWRRRAWLLALLNTLLAITLFANARLIQQAPRQIEGPAVPWLQAFWTALTFVWLLLQLYPVALLLEEEEGRARDIAWRNGLKAFKSNPGLTLIITLVVLAGAAFSALFPPIWFVVVAVLFAAAAVNAVLGWVRPS